MRKLDENALLDSCWNKATDTEVLFVLLGRDAAAPATIRDWVRHRLRLGKNKPEDPQIVHALSCAEAMERDQALTFKGVKHAESVAAGS